MHQMRVPQFVKYNTRIAAAGVAAIIIDAIAKRVFAQFCGHEQCVVLNAGVAWSIGAHTVWTAVLVGAALVFVGTWLLFARSRMAPMVFNSWMLILLAGVSNFIDRLQYGAVIDYMPFFGWFTGNGADIVITFSTAYLVCFFVLEKPSEHCS